MNSKTAQRINSIVSDIYEGVGSTRQSTTRRTGRKGYGWYTIVDVAYEGQREVFFKSIAEAEAKYAEAKTDPAYQDRE